MGSKISKYHFLNDYCQSKANKVAIALLSYLQQSAEEEKTLQTQNTKILYQLQFLFAWVLGLSVLGLKDISSLLHQIFIYKIVVLPQLC